MSSSWLRSQEYIVPQGGTVFADLHIDTCKTIEANGCLHAGNPGRRLFDSARGGTFEKLGPCEGTLIAADGSNKVIAIGGSDDIVVVVAIGDGDKVVCGKRHVCSKKKMVSACDSLQRLKRDLRGSPLRCAAYPSFRTSYDNTCDVSQYVLVIDLCHKCFQTLNDVAKGLLQIPLCKKFYLYNVPFLYIPYI